MTTVLEHAGGGPAAEAEPAPARGWGVAQWLALLAVPLLAYQAWTLGSWLVAGPHGVTEGRQAFTVSWWWARGIEVGAGALALALLLTALRESRRAGRMSFELKLWIALLLTSFWDTVTNFVQPIWFYSSDFVNLNEWWGHAPGYVSAAAGKEPFPVIALVLLYPCFVLESRLAVRAWSAIKRRHPGISNARLLGLAVVMALVIGAGISWMFIGPHLWAGPGMGPMIVSTAHYRWSIPEFLYVGVWSTTVCALRFFTDDQGRTLAERGMEHYSPRRQAIVSTLATTAWCSLAVIVYSGLVAVSGFYARPYPTGYPAHLTNVVCAIPGDPHTLANSYGPCPGSPGFRIPLGEQGGS